MFVCDSLAKSLWCKLSLHITLFEPTADFQWWITRHYSMFTSLTETMHPLLYWFAIECGMIHLSVFGPPEVTTSWGNGVCTMTDGEWPGKSLCSFEAEIHLWNTVFVYHSVLLKVTREVCLPYPLSLHNSVHQCSPMGTGNIHLPVFGLNCFTNKDLPFGEWRSHWWHVLLHLPTTPCIVTMNRNAIFLPTTHGLLHSGGNTKRPGLEFSTTGLPLYSHPTLCP